MTGYTKLFGSIIASTIWREDKETKIVWITMLAMANQDGIVEASIPGLADMARVTLPECEAALKCLTSPDPYSRTRRHDGKRVVAVEGGWKLLNHGKYRGKLVNFDRASYMRDYRMNGRDRSRPGKRPVNSGNNGKRNVSPVRHTEAEAEARGEGNSPQKLSNAQVALHDREYQRVIDRMQALKLTYGDHQTWTEQDRGEYATLKARKDELKRVLGLKA